jgi:predicted nucleotidyltransferase
LHVHGFDQSRATRDVDIGVAVPDWPQFQRVQSELMSTGQFSVVPGMAHRLRFRERDGFAGIPLDVVPFQGVEEGAGALRWPPRGDIVMNVAGFGEALQVAEDVQITRDLVVKVASLPGQALLKLVAWLDRRHQTPRDAQDLLVLFRRYGDAGNQERLYGERALLLEGSGFDIEHAGATLLGEDVKAMAGSENYERLLSSFSSPELRDRFLTHVSSSVALSGDDGLNRAQALVDAFFSGFAPANGRS